MLLLIRSSLTSHSLQLHYPSVHQQLTIDFPRFKILRLHPLSIILLIQLIDVPGLLFLLILWTVSPSSWNLVSIRSLRPRITIKILKYVGFILHDIHWFSYLLSSSLFQAVIKEEFSYYNSSGPKYEKFSKYLTINEMVRLHFDPYISTFDLSKQPILVLDKVTRKVEFINNNWQLMIRLISIGQLLRKLTSRQR